MQIKKIVIRLSIIVLQIRISIIRIVKTFTQIKRRAYEKKLGKIDRN